jgi:hypothetical protein
MEKNLTTDQIQEVLHKLSSFLEDSKAQWDSENPEKKAWFSVNKGVVIKATIFLISVTDNLIQFVENIIPVGSDKKAAVLLITAKLFDYISAQAFPIWLRPFVPVIKEVVVSVIISNLIEFIVQKYKAGYWKTEKENVK